jgi:membrane protease subunit (stomatin/prohibitin family)
MLFRNKVIGGAKAVLLVAVAATTSLPAQASNTGAFVGGMLTSRVLGNMHQRTEAEQQQAYYAQQNSQQQQQVQQAAPAAPAAQTPTQRINELDKLAAGGYITPAEYKKKKQAIVDSM